MKVANSDEAEAEVCVEKGKGTEEVRQKKEQAAVRSSPNCGVSVCVCVGKVVGRDCLHRGT